MARLPSVTDLGGSPAIAAERPVATYDATPIAKGAEAIASSMAQFGKVVENDAEVVADIQEKRQKQAANLAYSNSLAGTIDLREKYKHDQDYATLPQRWGADAQAIVDDHANAMPDGQIKAEYMAKMKVHLAQEGASIGEQAFGQHADAVTANIEADRNHLVTTLTPDPNDPTHNAAIDAHQALIDDAVSNGFMTRQHGQLQKETTARAIAGGDIMQTAASQPMRLLRETGGVPRGAEALPAYWNKEAARRATGVNQDLMGVVQRASEIAGVQFTIGDMGGTRDQATQDKLVAAGRSQTRNSNHLTGSAIDLIPLVNGKPNPDASPETFQAISAAMKQASQEAGIDINWGGDWKSFKDEAHFELAGKPRPAGEPSNPLWKLLPPETVLRAQQHARSVIQQQSNDSIKIAGQAQLAAAQGWERQIIDGTGGVAAMPDRKQIEDDPALDEGHRNNLLRQLDTAGRKNDSYNGTLIKFMTPDGGTFNPADKGETANLDQIYVNMGGDMKALQMVVNRTGVVPPTAAVGLIGALSSSNPQDVLDAAQMARNLMSVNERIFARVQDGKELSNAGLDYEQYTEHEGKTPQQAAQMIIEKNSPVYKSKIHATVKGEEIPKIIKENLSVEDLEAGFNESWLKLGPLNRTWGGPTVAFNPETRKDVFNDYAEIFKREYEQTGDIGIAKNRAIAQMGILYGVSHFTGKGGGNVMRFAPERAPAYANIPDAAGKIADDAIETIKAATVDRSNLEAADKELHFTPQERALYERHLTNLVGKGGVNNPDGSRSTLFQTSFETDGKTYNVPTVWDGKILKPDEAIARARKEGLDKFPSYGTDEEAEARYEKMHTFMERDTGSYLRGAEPNSKLTRDKIVLAPTPNGETAAAYMAGKPPPYLVGWRDQADVLHMLNPGRGFVYDPQAAAEKATEEHRAGLEAGNAAADATTARIAGDQAAMAHGSDTMAALGTPEYAQEAARRESGRDIEYQIRGLDRQEHALEKSGLGGAFLQAQRLRIATRRAELEQRQGAGVAAR